MGNGLTVVPPVVMLAEVTSPGKTYAFMDSGYITISYAQTREAGGTSVYLTGGKEAGSADSITGANFQNDFRSGRHSSGVVVDFTDGHAKWLKTKVVVDEAKKDPDPTAGLPQPGGAWSKENL